MKSRYLSVGLLSVCAVVAACASPAQPESPAATPVGSAFPDLSTLPTTQASEIPLIPSEAPPADLVPPGSVAVVTVDALRVRSDAGLNAAVVGGLVRGDEVFVTSSRKVADGLTWLYVQRSWLSDGDGQGGLGFVAQGNASGLFLEAKDVTCPSGSIDVAGLGAMTPWARLVCFGSRSVTLTAYDDPENYGFGGECNCVAEPGWLIGPFTFSVLSPSADQQHPWLFVRLAPAIAGEWPTTHGESLSVIGHFDDAASSTCRFGMPDPAIQPEVATTFEATESITLLCREQFVVTGITVLPGP